MAQRICPKCGHIENEYTYFCTECGSKTVESENNNTSAMKPLVTAVPEKKGDGLTELVVNISVSDKVDSRLGNDSNETINDNSSSVESATVEDKSIDKLTSNSTVGTIEQQISHKKTSVKINPIIIGLASTILVFVIIIAVLASGSNRESSVATQAADNPANGVTEADDIEEENKSPQIDQTTTSEGMTVDNEYETIVTEEIDVEPQVLEIREKYNAIVENINDGTFEKKVADDGISVYSDGASVKAVVVPKENNGNEYAEYFYFNEDEKLFFAYYESQDGNRFYFVDETLIRWRYSQDAADAQNAVDYDLERDNSDYKNWERRVLQEGYHYLELGLNSESSPDYILPESDSRYLEVRDLNGLSAEECRLARNELYARHGRLFDDETLQAYFDSKEWYKGTIAPSDFKEDTLNDYEMYNRDLIVRYEQEQGY